MKRITILALLIATSSAASAQMMNGNMMGRSAMSQEQPSRSQDAANKQNGYAVTQTYCTGCHQPPDPRQHTPQEWPRVIERMQTYMQQQRRRLPASSEVKLILQYLDNSHAHN